MTLNDRNAPQHHLTHVDFSGARYVQLVLICP